MHIYESIYGFGVCEDCKQAEEATPKQVISEQAAEIIETRRPRGLFFVKKDVKLFVGIDNSTGDAWTEDFRTLRSCKKWLKGE